MEKQFVIIKNGVVVDKIIIDENNANNYIYPFEHDLMLEDEVCNVAIGDIYNEEEQRFYMPRRKVNE